MNFYAMWSVYDNTDVLYVSRSPALIRNTRLTYACTQILGDRHPSHVGRHTRVHVARFEARRTLRREAVDGEETDDGTSQPDLSLIGVMISW